MFKKNTKPAGIAGNVMTRQESALWLGRSLSTNEVVLRSVVDLMNVAIMQQQMIEALYSKVSGKDLTTVQSDALAELDKDATQKLIKRLTETMEDLKPILKVVDEACATLQKEI